MLPNRELGEMFDIRPANPIITVWRQAKKSAVRINGFCQKLRGKEIMLKIIGGIVVASAVLAIGCGGSAPANSNSNKAAANVGTGPVNVDPANMPAGISTAPVQPSANTTPGIPATNVAVPKGATPTPGIPSPEELKKGIKPGTTPTPGIPSPEELKKAMSGKLPANAPPPPAPGDAPMMKSTKKKPQ